MSLTVRLTEGSSDYANYPSSRCKVHTAEKMSVTLINDDQIDEIVNHDDYGRITKTVEAREVRNFSLIGGSFIKIGLVNKENEPVFCLHFELPNMWRPRNSWATMVNLSM